LSSLQAAKQNNRKEQDKQQEGMSHELALDLDLEIVGKITRRSLTLPAVVFVILCRCLRLRLKIIDQENETSIFIINCFS
jgi:hypothetical protein